MSETSDNAPNGKIGRCPLHIREEVNRRLLDNEPAKKIIAWLHGQPEVLKVLDEYFGEEPISPQNLSEWRKGGYQKWLKRRERVAQTKELSDYSLKLARASGGNISDGAAAILAGQILELIEAGPQKVKAEDGSEELVFDLDGFTKAIVALRSTDLDARRVAQRERLLDQRQRQLELNEKQFEVRTCELFLKWYGDKKLADIVEGKARKEVKIEQLRLAMFGQRPDGDPPQQKKD